MAPHVAFCAFDPLFAASLYSTALNSASIQRQYLKVLHQFLREWAPHNLRSLRLTTFFNSSSPRTTETFVSLGPHCFFLYSRILEDFL